VTHFVTPEVPNPNHKPNSNPDPNLPYHHPNPDAEPSYFMTGDTINERLPR